MVGKISDAMDAFLGAVGLVTLALGAMGVVNIMLVSCRNIYARSL